MPELNIEIDREDDGRWIGEVPDLPGVMAYGDTQEAARRNTSWLAINVIRGKAMRERFAELRRLLSEAHAYGGLPRELRERIRVALARKSSDENRCSDD